MGTTDDYTPIIRGGLKLKGAAGAKPTGVEKKKKKKKKTQNALPLPVARAEEEGGSSNPISRLARKADDDGPVLGGGGGRGVDAEDEKAGEMRERMGEAGAAGADADDDVVRDGAEEEEDEMESGTGKTEAERRHEEMRRKRLHDRLARQGGAKTHKERVEELNRYLSRLSEHHDMPRIGPG